MVGTTVCIVGWQRVTRLLLILNLAYLLRNTDLSEHLIIPLNLRAIDVLSIVYLPRVSISIVKTYARKILSWYPGIIPPLKVDNNLATQYLPTLNAEQAVFEFNAACSFGTNYFHSNSERLLGKRGTRR